MTEPAGVMAGGGPAGGMMAGKDAAADSTVGGGFHARTIEILDQRGVADRFLAEGQVAQAAMLAATVLDMSDFPTRHPYSRIMLQGQIDRKMAAWIAELPARVYYGCE